MAVLPPNSSRRDLWPDVDLMRLATQGWTHLDTRFSIDHCAVLAATTRVSQKATRDDLERRCSLHRQPMPDQSSDDISPLGREAAVARHHVDESSV
jgi:hypothetical protein